MASGSLTVRVRPLRIAFLVDPGDRIGLLSAIEANSFLWGGACNPIIPAYKRTPKIWSPHQVRRLPHPDDIITGYLDAFDPDLVVPVGKCEERSFQVGHREIVRLPDLIGDISQAHSPHYGVGLLEVLADFIDKELKFQRNDDLKLLFPKLPNAYGLFLASVFGKLPSQAEKVIDGYFGKHLEVGYPQAKLDNYLDLIDPFNLFPRRLTTWSLSINQFANLNSSFVMLEVLRTS